MSGKSATLIMLEMDQRENEERWKALKEKFDSGAHTYTREEVAFIMFAMERMLVVFLETGRAFEERAAPIEDADTLESWWCPGCGQTFFTAEAVNAHAAKPPSACRWAVAVYEPPVAPATEKPATLTQYICPSCRATLDAGPEQYESCPECSFSFAKPEPAKADAAGLNDAEDKK
jgi:hypothetical protein